MSATKKSLNRQVRDALDKLREEVLRDLRHDHQPMRDQFRATARRIAERDEEAKQDQ
ncbi:MAG: hypothetical protein M1294_09070 [Firmicutes bacterium]|jgi:hypothetical protein|nr:hypothetical protein [Bacillota bacterium]MCL5014004.1 hypothetical protein [Bacillota bacterium]